MRSKGQGIDEFAFVLLTGLVIIIVMLFAWGVPSEAEIPRISPDSKVLSIEKGSSDSFILEINVTSKEVSLSSRGTIEDWISFSDNDFESEGLTTVNVTITVPFTAEEREHHGTIVVETMEGGRVTIPLTVSVLKITEKPEVSSRSIYLGDFSVSHVEGTETIKTVRNFEVRKSMYEDKRKSFSARIERDLDLITEGTIVLDVFYTNQEGNLIIKFNNEEVFNEKVMPGEVVIPIDKGSIKSYNVIEISSSGPGWKFWTSSVYKIDKVDFTISFFGELRKEMSFNVFSDEIENFKEGWLEFDVESFEGDGKLTVEINGYPVLEDRRRGFFRKSIDRVLLVWKENIITFSTEPGTSYQIRRAKITLIHEQPD